MISQQLKQVYFSNPRTLEAIETAEIHHPLFKQTFFIVNDETDHDLKLDDGTIQTFSAFTFEIIPPEKGSNQQDIQIVFDNVNRFAVDELENASQDYSIPITFIYRVYIKGDSSQQSTPIKLSLTNIAMNSKTISARASRTDIINRQFPYGRDILFDNRFKGIL